MTIEWGAASPFFNDDHRAYAETVRQFTTNEIVPFVDEWERGASFLRGSVVERLYRELRVQAIGGGSEEIMRDLASRQLGI